MVPCALFFNRRSLQKVQDQGLGLYRDVRMCIEVLAEHDRMQREMIRSAFQRFFNFFK